MITFEIRPPYNPTGRTEPLVQGVVFDNGHCALLTLREGASIETFPSFQAAVAVSRHDRVFWEWGAPYARRAQSLLIASLPPMAVTPDRDYNVFRVEGDDEVLILGPVDKPLYRVCIRDGGWIEDMKKPGDTYNHSAYKAVDVVDVLLQLFPRD